MSIMKTRVITDTDFIPREHYTLDAYEEIYRIEYELLYEKPNFNRTYGNVIRLVKEQTSPILRKSKLLMWEGEIKRSLKNLKSFVKTNVDIGVIIPFTNYEEPIEVTIQQFNFASIVLNELITCDNLMDIEKNNIEGNYKTPNIYELFSEYMINLQTNVYIDEETDWYLEVCFDEMIRRGLVDSKKMNEVGWNNVTFNRSQYYDNKDLFVELYTSKDEKIDKFSIDTLSINKSEEDIRMEDNKKVKCGVLYYALHEKVDEYTLTALTNYACNLIYNNKVKKKNTNSIEKYLRLYRKRDANPSAFYSDDLKPTVIEDVMKVLREYELEIPQTLSESQP